MKINFLSLCLILGLVAMQPSLQAAEAGQNTNKGDGKALTLPGLKNGLEKIVNTAQATVCTAIDVLKAERAAVSKKPFPQCCTDSCSDGKIVPEKMAQCLFTLSSAVADYCGNPSTPELQTFCDQVNKALSVGKKVCSTKILDISAFGETSCSLVPQLKPVGGYLCCNIGAEDDVSGCVDCESYKAASTCIPSQATLTKGSKKVENPF